VFCAKPIKKPATPTNCENPLPTPFEIHQSAPFVALLAYNVALETGKKAGKSFIFRELGEKMIFKAADKLRKNIGDAEHLLIFLKI
jgi:hypothetical protein